MTLLNSLKLNKKTLGTGLFILVALTVFSSTAFATPGPDLVVSSGPSLNISNPTEGDSVVFSATILNQGDANTGAGFTIRFRVDGSIIHDFSSDQLAKGSSRTREVTWTATAGNHTVRVCADAPSPGVIDELSETNNCEETNFTVASLPADTCLSSNGTSLSSQEFKDALDNGLITYDNLVVLPGDTTATFTINNQTNCIAPLSLASYKRFDDTHLSTQEFYDGTNLVNVGESATLTVDLPDCSTQVDAWFGLHPQSLLESNPYSYPHVPWVIDFDWIATPLCQDTPPPPSSPASCDAFSANPSSITNGGSSTLTWNTTNATSVSINNGVGSVSVDGSKVVSPSVTTTYTLTALGTEGNDTCTAKVTVGGNPPTIQCPLPNQANRTIIDFTDREGVIASDSEAEATTRQYGINLSSGNYKITLVSYDDHLSKPSQIQTEEQYFLKLLNAGNVFASTPSISDLPDNQEYRTEVVSNNFSINNNVNFVYAQHTKWWQPGDKESIVPVCAAFDKLTVVEQKADVTITKSVTPSSGKIGDTFTYTLTYKNNGAINAENVAIADVASPVGKLGSYTITQGPSSGGSCTAKTNGITCSLGTLSVGETGTIKYTAKGVAVGTIDNTAVINTSTPETNTNNNQDDAQVVVTSNGPAATCDSFTASPTNVNSGSSSTLTWATTNSTSVSINNGVGSVPVDGSVIIAGITSNVTYTLTAVGTGGNDTCTASITVNIPGAPICTLTLTPGSITSGSSATLGWSTTNVTSATINQGIGSATPVASGSTTVSPTTSTTYTMTAIGTNSSTITCNATLTVTTPPPSCTLSANPSVVTSGGSSTLTWATTNSTSASINQSIGSVTPVAGGSVGTGAITANTTYTLTAVGPGGTTSCPASVVVSATPLADVAITKNVTPDKVEKGGVFTYTLNYSNTGTLDALSTTINDIASPSGLLTDFVVLSGPAHGTCTANSNGISCSLGTLPVGASGTVTYKATGSSVGVINNTVNINTTTSETTLTNNSDSEQVSVFVPVDPPCVGACGGGMNPPRVVMFAKPTEEQPFASQSFIYLSQVPYTGITGGVKGIMFSILLSLWSAAAAYFIIRRWKEDSLVPNFGGSRPIRSESFSKPDDGRALSMGEIIETKRAKDSFFAKAVVPEGNTRAFVNKSEREQEIYPKEIAFTGSDLPTEKPHVHEEIIHEEKNEEVRTEIDTNLEKFARDRGVLVSEDALGMVTLPVMAGNQERQEALNSIINIALTMYPKDDGWIVLDKKRIEQVIFSSQYDVILIFSQWLSVGESKKVFSFIRLLRSHKVSVKSFLKKVAYHIDNLYRCRIGESLDNNQGMVDVENQCVNWNTKDIQKVVAILVNGVDESYDSEDASVKLALVKILEISDKSKVEGKSYYGS